MEPLWKACGTLWNETNWWNPGKNIVEPYTATPHHPSWSPGETLLELVEPSWNLTSGPPPTTLPLADLVEPSWNAAPGHRRILLEALWKLTLVEPGWNLSGTLVEPGPPRTTPKLSAVGEKHPTTPHPNPQPENHPTTPPHPHPQPKKNTPPPHTPAHTHTPTPHPAPTHPPPNPQTHTHTRLQEACGTLPQLRGPLHLAPNPKTKGPVPRENAAPPGAPRDKGNQTLPTCVCVCLSSLKGCVF